VSPGRDAGNGQNSGRRRRIASASGRARRVEKIDGKLWNREIQTVTDVKDLGKAR
jgi:hypothetical protein